MVQDIDGQGPARPRSGRIAPINGVTVTISPTKTGLTTQAAKNVGKTLKRFKMPSCTFDPYTFFGLLTWLMMLYGIYAGYFVVLYEIALAVRGTNYQSERSGHRPPW